MPPLNIIDSLTITINEYIQIDEYGDAKCNREYIFTNHTGSPLNLDNVIWEEYFQYNTSEFYLIDLINNERNKTKGLRTTTNDSSQLVEIPICETGPINILEGKSKTVLVDYEWKNFAIKLDKIWIFKYFYHSKLKKITINLKMEVIPATKINRISNWFRQYEIFTDLKEFQQRGKIHGGQFKGNQLSFYGDYFYGFKNWVETLRLILIGLAGYIIVETIKWLLIIIGVIKNVN